MPPVAVTNQHCHQYRGAVCRSVGASANLEFGEFGDERAKKNAKVADVCRENKQLRKEHRTSAIQGVIVTISRNVEFHNRNTGLKTNDMELLDLYVLNSAVQKVGGIY